MKTIDAQNKTLGRVATEAAIMLMGKDSADYAPNKIPTEVVEITNASKIKISEKKREEKEYTRYTGHPGGLRKESMEKVLTEKGIEEALRRAVKGMLPSNKLRPEMLKNLKVTD